MVARYFAIDLVYIQISNISLYQSLDSNIFQLIEMIKHCQMDSEITMWSLIITLKRKTEEINKMLSKLKLKHWKNREISNF